jgi:CheY-like chemotaxis protein
VVDDSKLARLSLIKSLNNNIVDAEIFQATNGLEAIEIVKSKNPDIVFLDLTMPEMDGYEAIPFILESNHKIKIIVVSADVQEKAKAKVIELGAQIHIQKPINTDKMKEILDII